MTAPRKHVFLIAGFDPKGGRYYRRLLAEAAQSRAEGVGSTALEAGPFVRDDLGGHWTLQASAEHACRPAVQANGRDNSAPIETATLCQFLDWHDLVRERWQPGWRGWLGAHWRVAASLRNLAVMWRVGQLARPAWWMAVAPILLTAGCLLIGVLLVALLLWALGGRLAIGADASGQWPTDSAVWLASALLAGAIVGLGLAHVAHRRLGTHWMLQLCRHAIDFANDDLPALDHRLDTWAEAIACAMAASGAAHGSQPGEVVVVGHSHGAALAIAALDRALARAPELAEGPVALSLLTLGHTTPMITAFPEARRFRAAQERVARCRGLTWLDLVAAADWASFPGLPAWASALPPGSTPASTTVLPATTPADGSRNMDDRGAVCVHAAPKFHRDMPQAQWERLRGDRRALHMHYLRATSAAGGFDILRALAGPSSLRDIARGLAGTPAASPGPCYVAA